MARIRTIKPDFWEDEKIGDLSSLARLMFIGTWNLADDEGLLRWSADYLKASLFMYDTLNMKQAERLMDELVSREMVYPYTSAKARQSLAYIVNFRKHQKINRPQPGKFPPPGLQLEPTIQMYGRRDDWKCGLCGHQVNRQRRFWEDRWSGADKIPGGCPDLNPSLDHIVPRSQGGHDYPSNIRLVHVGCNKSRGDRPEEYFVVPESVTRGLNDYGFWSGSEYVFDSLSNSVNGSLPDSPPEGKGREGKRKGDPHP